VDPGSLRKAVMPPLIALLDAIRAVLHRCPPDLVADLADRGIVLTGGSAVLPGLDSTIRQNTGMPVSVADEPGLCAVQGLGALVEGGVRRSARSRRREPDFEPEPEPEPGTEVDPALEPGQPGLELDDPEHQPASAREPSTA
jgi:rod shape-determining protein MreB